MSSVLPHGYLRSRFASSSFVTGSHLPIWLQRQHFVLYDGPLTRYVKLWVAHAPGMLGTFSPPPTSKETAGLRSRHASRHVRDAHAVMHIGIANPQWRGKGARDSRRMRNAQFYVSGKRPMDVICSLYRATFVVFFLKLFDSRHVGKITFACALHFQVFYFREFSLTPFVHQRPWRAC